MGKGTGDLYIKANCGIIFTESFVVQDCYYFDPQTTDKNRYTVASGGASITYGSNGCTITGTANSVSLVKNTALTLPSEYEATFEITGLNGETSGHTAYGGIVFDDWFTDWYSDSTCATYKLSTTSMLSRNLQNPSVNDVIKIVREGNTMKQYINDVLVSTDTNINHTGYFQYRTYKGSSSVGRSITVKNLKIKPL